MRMEVDNPNKIEIPNKWTLIKKPKHIMPVLTHEEIAERMTKLNHRLLAEVEALPIERHMTHTQIFDTMNRKGHYNTSKDDILHNGIAMVRREELRKTQDHGPSISKERFSSKYWSTWNNDYILLEDLTRAEMDKTQMELQENKNLGLQAPMNKKNQTAVKPRKKMTPLQLSHQSGSTFGLPKTTRSETFDLHQMGNRNDVLEIFTKSLGYQVPESLNISSLLNIKANVDPNCFERKTIFPGGSISSGPARPSSLKSVTAGCDMPPVDRPQGSPKMVGFYGDGRNSSMGKVAAAGGGGGDSMEYKVPANALGFSRDKRGTEAAREEGPGPGAYEVSKTSSSS